MDKVDEHWAQELTSGDTDKVIRADGFVNVLGPVVFSPYDDVKNRFLIHAEYYDEFKEKLNIIEWAIAGTSAELMEGPLKRLADQIFSISIFSNDFLSINLVLSGLAIKAILDRVELGCYRIVGTETKSAVYSDGYTKDCWGYAIKEVDPETGRFIDNSGGLREPKAAITAEPREEWSAARIFTALILS